MTNDDLVAAIQNGDQSAKEALCQQNTGLVYLIAKRYSALSEAEDLRQEAFVGLLEAAQSYTPEKGSFANWAVLNMKAQIFRNTNGLIALPEHIKVKVNKYRQYLESYQKEHGTAPTDFDVMDDLQISSQELDTIRDAAATATLASLQDEENTLEESIPAPGDMAGEIIQAEYERQRSLTIWKAVDELPPEQAETIRKRYIDEKTQAEIGTRARQDEAKALRALRKNKGILQYYDDIRSESMRGTSLQRFKETWTSSTERTALSHLE